MTEDFNHPFCGAAFSQNISRQRKERDSRQCGRNDNPVHFDGDGRDGDRIVQLGGAPNFSPEGLQSRSHAEYVEGETLKEMVKEDLIAERIAIDSYREIATYLGDKDPTTRRIMEEILAQEEEHADDMASILESL